MILVTGGTGFIGAHLLYHLVDGNRKVRAMRRPGSSDLMLRKIFSYYSENPEHKWQQIEWVDGDLTDITSLQDIVSGCDQIYHAGAVVSFHGEDKREIIRTNIEGTANLVNACLEEGVSKILFVSSIGALGRAVTQGLVDEETHFQASKKNSVYSRSKYEAEKEVWRGQAEGLDVVVVNPAIVVGPGDWSKGSPQLFQTMGKGLKFYSSGMNGFIDVNDVARIMIQLMESDYSGERFILSAENVSYRQFFTWMARAMNMAPPHIPANRFLSSIGWRLLKAKGWLTGKRSGITRETAKTANQVYRYSNRKLISALPFGLTPVKESVEQTARLFLLDQNKG